MSETTELTQPEKFLQNVVDLTELLQELIAVCYEKKQTTIHPSLIQVAGKFILCLNKIVVIETFIKRSYPYWDRIINREEKFFLENTRDVFGDLPEDHVDGFRVLFSSRDKNGKLLMCEEDKNAIWDFFDSLVRIAIVYIHEKRIPKLKDNRKIYTIKYETDIDIIKYAHIFKVVLQWN